MGFWYTYLTVLGDFGWDNDIQDFFSHSPYAEYMWILFFLTIFFG